MIAEVTGYAPAITVMKTEAGGARNLRAKSGTRCRFSAEHEPVVRMLSSLLRRTRAARAATRMVAKCAGCRSSTRHCRSLAKSLSKASELSDSWRSRCSGSSGCRLGVGKEVEHSGGGAGGPCSEMRASSKLAGGGRGCEEVWRSSGLRLDVAFDEAMRWWSRRRARGRARAQGGSGSVSEAGLGGGGGVLPGLVGSAASWQRHGVADGRGSEQWARRAGRSSTAEFERRVCSEGLLLDVGAEAGERGGGLDARGCSGGALGRCGLSRRWGGGVEVEVGLHGRRGEDLDGAQRGCSGSWRSRGLPRRSLSGGRGGSVEELKLGLAWSFGLRRERGSERVAVVFFGFLR